LKHDGGPNTVNGALDPTFAGDGRARIDVGDNDFAKAIAIQPDRRILVAGACCPGGGDGVVFRMFGESDPAVSPRPPVGDRIAPRISGAHLTRKRFAVGPRGTPRVAARRAKRGTTFVFRLSEAAPTRIVLERALPGRRRGGRCVKPRKGLRRHCTRFVKSATLTRAKARLGLNQIAFSGRVGKRRLRPGAYRAVLTAIDPAGNRSRAIRLSFRVVRG
jgi:hypothetical protein